MNEINKIYQAHMSHELKLVVDPNHAVLNKDKVEAKVLAFLCELGKVGDEAKYLAFGIIHLPITKKSLTIILMPFIC